MWWGEARTSPDWHWAAEVIEGSPRSLAPPPAQLTHHQTRRGVGYDVSPAPALTTKDVVHYRFGLVIAWGNETG